jgi:hypothetical protein
LNWPPTRSGGHFETVVLDQFAAVGLQMILDYPNSCHRRENTGSTASKIPVMCQQLSHIHDLNTGCSGFPELALFENRKGGGFFKLHVRNSVPQKLCRNELYLTQTSTLLKSLKRSFRYLTSATTAALSGKEKTGAGSNPDAPVCKRLLAKSALIDQYR